MTPRSEGYNRQSAKNVLRNKIDKIKSDLKSHEVLLDHINWDDLTTSDEEKLWIYFINR